MNHKIVIGPDLTRPYCEFDSGDIYSLSMDTGVDIVGAELTVDVLTSQVNVPYANQALQIITPWDYDMVVSSDGYVIAPARQIYTNPRLLPYGTIIRYFRDGGLMAKMYLKSVDRVAKNIYKINVMSAIGLLDAQKHYGNIYRGALFADVVAEIIGGAVEFTVADDVKNLKVYGWLPYDTKRANLHQLLFANGVMCGKDGNGDILFRFVSNKSPIAIPKNRIYYGGQVDYPAFASAVDVTEHSFFALPTDEVAAVYDNTDGSETANNTFIAFRDAPLHDLATTGTLVINSSGVNWAIVTGTGILTGKKYAHSTRIMRRVADNAGDQRENVATVADSFLVNVTNSDNVARRVLAYYNARKIVTASIAEENEKCGDLITAFDPYDEHISGFLRSMRSEISGITKTQCEIVTDYIPTGYGSNYTHYVVLTGGGTWVIPQEVLGKESPIIQVTMISGGHGGAKGDDGEEGITSGPSWGPATSGGDGGEPGIGGRIFTVSIDCSGKTSFAFSCGVGGESAKAGQDTTFDKYSSSSGNPSTYGIANIFTGELYGTTGEKGVAGGEGQGRAGQTTIVTYKGQTWYLGERRKDKMSGEFFAEAGGGGGPAVGSNGGMSWAGTLDLDYGPQSEVYARGGGGWRWSQRRRRR